jgi:hypothetical protein
METAQDIGIGKEFLDKPPKAKIRQASWYIPVIPALKWLELEDPELRGSLDYKLQQGKQSIG